MNTEDLKRDVDLTKKDACLLQNSHSLAELENLRVEEKLQRILSKCVEYEVRITKVREEYDEKIARLREEYDEKITRLNEENKASCDRAKRAEESIETLSKEFSLKISEKDKSILNWSWQTNNLQKKCLENEQLVVDLRRDKELAQLKLQNLEATCKLKESRQEKTGPDRNVKVEEGLSAKGKKVDLTDIIKAWKDTTNADAQNAAKVSGVACGASIGTPFVMKEEDGATTGRTSASQFKHNSSGAEINGTAQNNEEKKPVFSGSHAIPTCTPSGSQRSSKMAPCSTTSKVIEISDSDDEAKSGGTTYISNTSSVKITKRRKLV